MGARPADVAAELLREYLVQVSVSRLAAYRRYREEFNREYLTARKLEDWHWEILYGMVSSETIAPRKVGRASHSPKYIKQCRFQRNQ